MELQQKQSGDENLKIGNYMPFRRKLWEIGYNTDYFRWCSNRDAISICTQI